MTNITYFYNTIREDSSVSTASEQEEGNPDQSHQPQALAVTPKVVKVEPVSSLYSTITKACLACARPPADDSTTDLVHQWVNSQATEVNLENPSFDSGRDFPSASVVPTLRNEDMLFKTSNLKTFSFSELKTATRSFRPSAAVKSSFGSVFKGWIDGHTLAATKLGMGIAIAVKLLDREIFQNQMEWLEKVNNFGPLYHPNLVRLLGYCLEDNHRMLVYEFMPRGSLDDLLFWRRLGFPWSLRMKVALGAAQGLAFLHSNGGNNIHGNFKSSNILLDENYNAKVTDFGLRNGRPTYPIGVMETMRGDFGYGIIPGTQYDAPEYYCGGDLTDKSDVYSFGVVLLEILCGRRAFDNNCPHAERNLIQGAREKKHGLYGILGSRLEGQCPLICVNKLTILVGRCLSIDAKLRPDMDTVVRALQELE